jgi:DNA (cytosine-5)-methyltransferase 1
MGAIVIDLFCGIGGLSYGFRQEGFDVLAGIDSDPTCSFAFEANIGARFVPADIRSLSDRRLSSLFPRDRGRDRILVGCAPCQPFSIYAGRYRNKTVHNDTQWKLLDDFARAIRVTKPHVVSMENVARVTKHEVFRSFVADLGRLGYTVTYQLVRAHDYGVPQKRTRLVLFASKYGKLEIVEPTHKARPRTVREVIGHLPPVTAGEVPRRGDRLHRSRGLSEINRRRLKATKQGGFWREWDEELQLECHKRESGASFRSVYGRMCWDVPSPVITTQCLGIGNGRFGHPEQDRAITIREAALLQSFPMKFKFLPPSAPVYGAVLARQIGNAVPVRLARAVARSIKLHLRQLSPRA